MAARQARGAMRWRWQEAARKTKRQQHETCGIAPSTDGAWRRLLAAGSLEVHSTQDDADKKLEKRAAALSTRLAEAEKEEDDMVVNDTARQPPRPSLKMGTSPSCKDPSLSLRK